MQISGGSDILYICCYILSVICHLQLNQNAETFILINPNSRGIFSSRSAVAWYANWHTAECTLKQKD